MLVKESLAFFFAIILLNYMNNECEAIQCYSCSDCSNGSNFNWSVVSTVNVGDQCMKAEILINQNTGQRLVYRGASSTCNAHSSLTSTILCCRSDLCNA